MKPGEVVGGRFRLEGSSQGGGMGVVHRAIDLVRGHAVVALKVLGLQSTESDGEAATRFLLEAEILEQLDHPAIVRHVAHGQLDAAGGRPFLVMEWIDGPTLERRLDGRPLRVQDALLLARRLAEALGVAHGAGVVHRDVKPANVMLPGGELASAKLVDFGVARAQGSSTLTQTGVRVGTPRYMAPEQIKSARDVDARADLFSLGCVLFESLAGVPAFPADNAMAVMVQILFEPPPRLGDLRPDLADPIVSLTQRLLARDRDVRPRSAEHVVRELDALLGHLADGTMVAPRSSLPDPALARLVVRALPRPDGPLVGRRAELARLDAAHARGAAVVLWGPPGVGKSRLLVEAAFRGREAPSGPAWLVDMSAVRKPHEVGAAIARSLGVRAPSAEAVPDAVTTALRVQPDALLLLDRAEHVAGFLPEILDRLGEACPTLRVVVASRVRIAGAGVEPIEVGPLPEADAVAFFAQRAHVDPGAAGVATVCRALDHVPLALELAAARVDALGLDGVRARLHRRDLLSDGARTMEGTVAWSFELLSPDEQRATARLSVFRGGFSLEAAEAVLEGLPGPLDLVQGLRHKSLLARHDVDQEPRLVMLGAVRELALPALTAEERAVTGTLHRRCFVEVGTTARLAHERTGSAAALQRLARELEDLQAAAEHALEAGEGEDACALAAAIEPVLTSRGAATTALGLIERALACASAPTPAVSAAVIARARALGAVGRADDGLADLRSLAGRADEGARQLELGVLAHVRGTLADAKNAYEEAAAHLARSGDERGEARALANLGALAHDEGRLDEAEALYREAVALFSSVGDLRLRGVTLGNLALALQERGALADAQLTFAEAVTHLEAYQDVRLLGVVLGNAGVCELEAGSERARPWLERAQALLAPTGDNRSLGLALGRLAAALALEGRVGDADARFARADRVLERHDALSRAAVSALRATSDVHRAEEALGRGRPEDALAHLRVAAGRIAQAEAGERSGAFGRRSDDVRTALRLLVPRIEALSLRVHAPADRHEPS